MIEIKQHTPGPWKIIAREVLEDGSVYPAHIVGGIAEFQVCLLESFSIAKLANDEPDSHWAMNAKTEKNSHLIAASPDMLEALRGMLEVYGVTKISLSASSVKVELCDMARAAVAKAEGRS